MPKYTPNKYQLAVHTSPARFRVVVWHRQAGKTTLSVNEVIRWAKEKPGRYWIVLPTYRQAKTVVWPMLLAFLPPDWVRKANESALEVKLKNGAEIALKGSENKDALRGPTLNGVVLDEVSYMSPDVWTEILRPTLLRTGGWALFIGTPFGKNHFYNYYQWGLDDSQHDWKTWQMSAEDSKIIDPVELEKIRLTTPQNIFEAEYLAKFLDGAGQVFRRVREVANVLEAPPKRDRLYRIGVDLARVNNFTAISVIDRHTFQQVHLDRFNQLDWPLQKARIEAVSRRYNNAEIVIDSTGAGDVITSDLSVIGLNLWTSDTGVIGFKYHTTGKKKLIENLAKSLEQGRVRILAPSTDLAEKQCLELEAFMYTKNEETGVYRYHAPEGQHDDMVNALALSVWDIGSPLPISESIEGQKDSYYENPYE